MALLNHGQPQKGRKILAEKVNAAVRTAPQTTEFREYDMPDIPDEAALLKVEVPGSVEQT